MTASASRHRWVGAALALLALVLGFGTVAVAAAPAPALAASYIRVCFPVYDSQGNYLGRDCHEFHLPVERDPCPPCPDWGIGIEHLVNPADPWWVRDLVAGMRLLDQAASDPRQAQKLRAGAQEAFLLAAERLGEAGIRLGEVGILDPERGTIEPVPQPWLDAAGADVVDGIGLMRQALAEPEPQPWLDAAMEQLQQAHQEIVQQQPIDG